MWPLHSKGLNEIVFTAGLQGKHVLASAMARSAAGVQGAGQEKCTGETRRRHVEHDLDPGHVPEERERRQVPRSHRRESLVEVERPRSVVVRHQVSNDVRLTPTCFIELMRLFLISNVFMFC